MDIPAYQLADDVLQRPACFLFPFMFMLLFLTAEQEEIRRGDQFLPLHEHWQECKLLTVL
jgi:hypothetical protein